MRSAPSRPTPERTRLFVARLRNELWSAGGRGARARNAFAFAVARASDFDMPRFCAGSVATLTPVTTRVANVLTMHLQRV